MLYYKLLGKQIVFTAHNVNAGKRDQNDSWLNRLSLKIQYSLCDHIFVHTEGMKTELISEFRIPESKVSVIPFGINNTVPNTALSSVEAKRQLGYNTAIKRCCFWKHRALQRTRIFDRCLYRTLKERRSYRLIIVGKPKGSKSYWNQIRADH